MIASSFLIRVLYVTALSASVTVDSTATSSVNQKLADAVGEHDVIIAKLNNDDDENREPSTSDVDGSAAKRKWGEKTMLTWGKRSQESSQSKKLRCIESLAAAMSPRDRRRWGEKTMSAWGKRTPLAGGDPAINAECEQFAAEALDEVMNKRKWGENTMQVWGKRLSPAAEAGNGGLGSDSDDEEIQASDDKRKWGENSMSAWGKRGTEVDTVGETEKRKWGSNSMKVWGKRDARPVESGALRVSSSDADEGTDRNEAVRSMGSSRFRGWPYRMRGAGLRWSPKRKWETNTMKVWGKRSLGGRPVDNVE